FLGLDGGRVLKNEGSLAFQSNSDIVLGYNPFVGAGTSASITNTATGVFDFQGDGQDIFRLNLNPNNKFTNAGTLRKSSGFGTSFIGNGIAFSNSGKVQVQTGTLEFIGSTFTNTNTAAGAISISSGATLSLLAGGSSTAGAFSVAGTLELGGGTFNPGAGTIAGNGTTELTSSTSLLLLGANSVTIAGKFDQESGRIDGTGKLTVNGSTSFGGSGAAVQTGNGTTDLKGVTTISGIGADLALDGGRVLQNDGALTLQANATIDLGERGAGTNATISNGATG